jgi:hypothetical protein
VLYDKYQIWKIKRGHILGHDGFRQEANTEQKTNACFGKKCGNPYSDVV